VVSVIDVMRRRVDRLLDMAECLKHSVCPDLGLDQVNQLSAMSSQLDAMRLTCIDRMRLSDRNLPQVSALSLLP